MKKKTKSSMFVTYKIISINQKLLTFQVSETRDQQKKKKKIWNTTAANLLYARGHLVSAPYYSLSFSVLRFFVKNEKKREKNVNNTIL